MFDSTISPLRIAYVISLVFVVGILIAAAIKRRSNHSPTGIQATGNDVAQADACAVPDGATATNFQLLSVFPNVSFGMQGLVVIPLMNVISFLIGNFLVLRWFRGFLNAVREHATPHNFIAKSHGVPSLRRATALISLFVFTSVACFEIVYLSRISKAVIGGTDSSYYVLVAMLTVSIMLVSIVGGQAVSLSTDRWLLVVAYWGTHLAVGFMAMLLVSAKPDMTSLVVIVLLLIMVSLRLRQFRSASGRSRIRHLVILLSTIFLLSALFLHKVVFVDWTNSWWANVTEQLTPAGTGLSPMTYAFAAMGSFCAAVFFNFVDFSFWQKYLAEQRSGDNVDMVLERVRTPFFVYVIESPLSWLLPAVLGLYALGLVTGANVDQNPITAIVLFLAQNSIYGAVVSIFFYCSLVAIAASTVCGYFASTGYLISADLMPVGDSKSDHAA